MSSPFNIQVATQLISEMQLLQVWLAAEPSRKTLIAVKRTIIACESLLAAPLIGLRTSQLEFSNAQSRIECVKRLIDSGEHSSNELNAHRIQIHKSVDALREIVARWDSWASEGATVSPVTFDVTGSKSRINPQTNIEYLKALCLQSKFQNPKSKMP